MNIQSFNLVVLISLIQVSSIFCCQYCSQQLNKESCTGHCLWFNRSCSFIPCVEQYEGCESDGDSTYCHLDKNKNCVQFTTCANVPEDVGCPGKCIRGDSNNSCIDKPVYESCAKVPKDKCGDSYLIGNDENIHCYLQDNICTNVVITDACETYKTEGVCNLATNSRRNCEWKNQTCQTFTCNNRKQEDCQSYLTNVHPPTIHLCYFISHNKTCISRDRSSLSYNECGRGETQGQYIYDGFDEICYKCGNSSSNVFAILIVALLSLILL